MTDSAEPEVRPLFLPIADRRIFAIACLPRPGPTRAGLIICPPFAEEMNRSRRTLRLLAEAAARRGIAAIYPDLSGTGDSEGDFACARWDSWLEEIHGAAAWLGKLSEAPLVFLGLRAGALLAWHAATHRSITARGLVLCQAVLDGKAVVTDMLRSRMAAMQGSESVKSMRQRLAAGETIEAAGYALSPRMVDQLNACRIDLEGTASVPPTRFIEVVADAAATARPPIMDLVSRLRDHQVMASIDRQIDPPFWATTEISVGRATIREAVRWLEGCA